MLQNNVIQKREKKEAVYLVVKRLFDFLSSLLLSFVLILPFVIIILLIVVKDFGNPFYLQKRIGIGGSVFTIVKFRSMRSGADRLEEMLSPSQLDEYRSEYKLDDDPRLIGYRSGRNNDNCFGRILRRSSLDELPQIIWNICIRGNMSVVGPRPILREELEKYYTAEEQELLVSVKPGLTGYWQAYARNNANYKSGERQRMELYYVQNRSLGMDIKIMFATIKTVISKFGAK